LAQPLLVLALSQPRFARLAQPLLLVAHLPRLDERLLRDLDAAELAHLLLARLLLLEELALARGVAAVALRGHVLAQGAYRFAGDDLAADGRLDGDDEQVRRDQLLQLLAHLPAAALRRRAV